MPQIRPITDLRNTNEISELCHARREPVFITKNGYGDLVIMSMETYEALTAPPPAEPRQGELRFLTEQEPVWAGVLAEVLERNRIPFVKESSMGAGLAIKTGALLEGRRAMASLPHRGPVQALDLAFFAAPAIGRRRPSNLTACAQDSGKIHKNPSTSARFL